MTHIWNWFRSRNGGVIVQVDDDDVRWQSSASVDAYWANKRQRRPAWRERALASFQAQNRLGGLHFCTHSPRMALRRPKYLVLEKPGLEITGLGYIRNCSQIILYCHCYIYVHHQSEWYT